MVVFDKKFLFGAVAGAGVLFVIFFGYRQFVSPYYTLVIPKFVSDTSSKVISESKEVVSLKDENLSLEEKLSSTNKRLDDILIFGGIIVTLLIAINVSVYVNAEGSVEKYLRDNIDLHKQKILKTLAETQEAAGKINAEVELVQKLRKEATDAIRVPTQNL